MQFVHFQQNFSFYDSILISNNVFFNKERGRKHNKFAILFSWLVIWAFSQAFPSLFFLLNFWHLLENRIMRIKDFSFKNWLKMDKIVSWKRRKMKLSSFRKPFGCQKKIPFGMSRLTLVSQLKENGHYSRGLPKNLPFYDFILSMAILEKRSMAADYFPISANFMVYCSLTSNFSNRFSTIHQKTRWKTSSWIKVKTGLELRHTPLWKSTKIPI